MTPAQTSLYWREWAKAKTAIEQARCEVLKSAEADAMRYALHAQAGAPRSSKLLNNRTLDLVLAAFWSVSHYADIDPQMRQMDQPITRCRHVADDLFRQIHAELVRQERPDEAAKVHEGQPRDNYLAVMLRSASKGHPQANPQDYPVQTWMSVIKMLTYRLNQLLKTGGYKGFRAGAKSRATKPAQQPKAQPAEFSFDRPAPQPATPRRTRAAAPMPTGDNPF